MMRIRGEAISARPSASICCSPPLMLPAIWWRRSCSRGKVFETEFEVRANFHTRAGAIGAQQQVLFDC